MEQLSKLSNHPLPTEETEELIVQATHGQVPGQQQEEKPHGIFSKMQNVIGSKQKTILLVMLFIFTGLLVLLAVTLSLTKKPAEQPPLPEPLPLITPSPTPVTEVNQDDMEQLIGEIDALDVEKTDILPPGLDFQIKI